MDPVTLILSALVAGASAAAKETASQAAKDAYSGFKELLARKLRHRPDAAAILQEPEKAPEEWRTQVEKELTESGVANDKELIRAARAVMAMADPNGVQIGKYNVIIKGSKGIVTGHHQTITMNFDDKD